MKVGVLDYGVGNVGSVLQSLEELQVMSILIDRAVDLSLVDVLILPGVGGFTECMRILDENGWTDAIRQEVLTNNKPSLGICLGMQLLADYGEEGANPGFPTKGLGLISGKVVSLKSLGCLSRLPHVGWNSISVPGDSSLFDTIPDGTDFYFVHSYAFVPSETESCIAVANYGVEIAAAVNSNNVWGTQFHPEKSSRAGFRLLKNFIQGCQC
jgi:glutamine amidotransferase